MKGIKLTLIMSLYVSNCAAQGAASLAHQRVQQRIERLPVQTEYYETPMPPLRWRNMYNNGATYFVDGVQIRRDPHVPDVFIAIIPQTPEAFGRIIFTKVAINHIAASDVNGIVASVPGVYQRRRGDDILVKGF